MKTKITSDTKISNTLYAFVKYCLEHSDQRFWQALRNWSKSPYILKSSHFDPDMFDEKFIKKHKKSFNISDTFYEN